VTNKIKYLRLMFTHGVAGAITYTRPENWVCTIVLCRNGAYNFKAVIYEKGNFYLDDFNLIYGMYENTQRVEELL